MSEEVETLGEAAPPLNDLSRTVKSFMKFSNSVIPPPQISGSAPGGSWGAVGGLGGLPTHNKPYPLFP